MSLITIDSILNPTSESIGLRNQILNRKPIPNWIKVRAPTSDEFYAIEKMTKNLALNTVCQEAACPNIAACWKKKHATFLAMGDICTRKCRFCNIKNGQPKPLDSKEPYNIAISVKELGLKHVVITSVDRDDLSDGGASHFVNIINEIRKINLNTTIEILTPDFLNKEGAIEKIVKAKPYIFNHNIETVRRLFKKIKLGGKYDVSLTLLKQVKELDNEIITKSGIIVGMGETNEEIFQSIKDLRENNVEYLTIGQYLKPHIYENNKNYIDVDRYVTLKEFEEYKKYALEIGFKNVVSFPLARSSYYE